MHLRLTSAGLVREETDAQVIANLQRKGWEEFTPEPEPEPEPPIRRVWANNRAFWETFTAAEQNAIAAAIPGLSVTLAMWNGEVWSDDERIQTAMTALVGATVLTQERANEILTPPGLLTP